MKHVYPLQNLSISKRIALTALFASLCLVGTIVIAIPLPFGYFNVGDVFVLLSAWLLGPIYGCIAAGLGSALADLVTGYAMYAPFTLVIKACSAFTAYMVWRLLKTIIKQARYNVLLRLLSALIAETVMVVGYLLTETIFYGFGVAVGTLLGNALQGGCCLLLATMVLSALYPIKGVAHLFPHIKKEE